MTAIRKALAELLDMYDSDESHICAWYVKYSGLWAKARAALAAQPAQEDYSHTKEYWQGHDEACAGVARRWEDALDSPIPKPGVMNEPFESLYRRTEALRLAAQPAQEAQPVATVTECEACFTPDACQLRGKCDHYSAEQLRIAAQPAQAQPIGGGMTKAELLTLADKLDSIDPFGHSLLAPQYFGLKQAASYLRQCAALAAQPAQAQPLDRDFILGLAAGELDCVDEEYIVRFARLVERAVKGEKK